MGPALFDFWQKLIGGSRARNAVSTRPRPPRTIEASSPLSDSFNRAPGAWRTSMAHRPLFVSPVCSWPNPVVWWRFFEVRTPDGEGCSLRPSFATKRPGFSRARLLRSHEWRMKTLAFTGGRSEASEFDEAHEGVGQPSRLVQPTHQRPGLGAACVPSQARGAVMR